jgi:hypothetical protein
MPTTEADHLISEPIQPVKGTFDGAAMARAEPGLPQRFVWRDQEYTIQRVLEKRRGVESAHDCPGCMYLRKHWYRIQTTCGREMTLYFDRQPRRGKDTRVRWWLFSIAGEGDEA